MERKDVKRDIVNEIVTMIDDSKDFPDKASKEEAKKAVRDAFKEEGIQK